MEKRDLAIEPFVRIDPHGFVILDPKSVARIEHIEAMLEASEKEKCAEARVRVLEEALRKIAEPCNVYGEDAKEMRDTARQALKGGTHDD